MEFLKKNALKFLEKAEESLEKEEYSLSKYFLFKKYGDFLKTNSLKKLFYLTDEKF